MKKTFLAFFLILLFFTMLINSSYTFRGALNGLNLWLFTVTPSLLPYMIISSFMTETGTFRYLSRLFAPVTKYVFRLSPDCGYVILLGFLCGYPIGSKLSADLVKKGHISRTEGQILLSFCNNVSPAFLVTYLIDQIIGIPEQKGLILSIMIGTPLLFGIILSRLTFKRRSSQNISPASACEPLSSKASLDASISCGFENIFKLGGYIILFSILNEFISQRLTASPFLQHRICALTEITSGLNTYTDATLSQAALITECITLTSFGGFCCIAQTASMIRGSGLNLFLYIAAKIAIAALALFFTCLLF